MTKDVFGNKMEHVISTSVRYSIMIIVVAMAKRWTNTKLIDSIECSSNKNVPMFWDATVDSFT